MSALSTLLQGTPRSFRVNFYKQIAMTREPQRYLHGQKLFLLLFISMHRSFVILM